MQWFLGRLSCELCVTPPKLAPFRLNEEKLFEEHQGSLYMVKRLLGSYPQTMTTMALFPFAFAFVGKVAQCFNGSPACDLGVSIMTKQVRRIIQTITAMTAECGYCSMHNVGLGDLFGGGLMHQAKPLPMNFDPEKMTEKERAAARLTVRSVKVPAEMTPMVRESILKVYGLDGYQTILGPMLLIGYLSTMMETMGAEIEPDCFEYAKKALGDPQTLSPTDLNYWNPSRATSSVTHPPAESTKFWNPNAIRDPTADYAAHWLTRTIGRNPLTNVVDLFFNISKASAERPTLDDLGGNIPKSVASPGRELDAWLKAATRGVLPRSFQSLTDAHLKQCLCVALWMLLLASADDVPDPEFKPYISATVKLRMATAYFVATRNGLAARHFGMAACRAEAAGTDVVAAVVEAVRVGRNPRADRLELADGGATAKQFETLLIKMAACEATRQRSTLDQLSLQLLDMVTSPSFPAASLLTLPSSVSPTELNPGRVVIEAVSVLGVCAMWQRFSAATDDFAGLEEEVLAFYRGEGSALEAEFGALPHSANRDEKDVVTQQQQACTVWGGRIDY
ncbi:hypothetical protein DFJ73DRAFT_846902 [Zopfochytrium polystomum]|nr:hypothetical protein DFJ73DRAFT_846902 [Zopfochytrium polystomum]